MDIEQQQASQEKIIDSECQQDQSTNLDKEEAKSQASKIQDESRNKSTTSKRKSTRTRKSKNKDNQVNDQEEDEDDDDQGQSESVRSATKKKRANTKADVEKAKPQLDSSITSFWWDQKLPEYKEELKKYLEQGLPVFSIDDTLCQSYLSELQQNGEQLQKQEFDLLLYKFLLPKIESSTLTLPELSKLCFEHISDQNNSTLLKIDQEYTMTLIANFANRQPYTEIKPTYLKEDDIKTKCDKFKIWETNDVQLLSDFSDIEIVNFVKSQRKWIGKAIFSLDRLLKAIERMKNESDVEKVWKFKAQYENILSQKKTEMPSKKQKQSLKRKHQGSNNNEGAEDSEQTEEIKQTEKKVKIDKKAAQSSKNNKQKVVKRDGEMIAEEGQENSDQPQKGKESSNKKVDNSQKNIFSFFGKKQQSSKVTPPPAFQTGQIPQNKSTSIAPNTVQSSNITQKSRFRCLGSIKPKHQWDEQRRQQFDELIASMNGSSSHNMINTNNSSLHEVINNLKLAGTLSTQATFKRSSISDRRKIYISIHDSFSRRKGLWDQKSRYIRGKLPFEKDQTIIDYDIDSEEEYENQNADNIDENEDKEDEESEYGDDDSQGFIVSDGHLSERDRQEKFKLQGDLNEDDDEDDFEDLNVFRNQKQQSNDEMRDKPKLFFFSMIENYEPKKDASLDEYLSNFKVTKLINEDYPLKPKKIKENLNAEGKVKLNSEAVNDESVIKEIVRQIHGEYGKMESIEKLNQQFPDCSKKNLERKILEIAIKEKRDGETKPRWLIPKELFLKYVSKKGDSIYCVGTEEEYDLFLKVKLEKEQDRVKLEKEKIREKKEQEKKLKQAQNPQPEAASQNEQSDKVNEEKEQNNNQIKVDSQAETTDKEKQEESQKPAKQKRARQSKPKSKKKEEENINEENKQVSQNDTKNDIQNKSKDSEQPSKDLGNSEKQQPTKKKRAPSSSGKKKITPKAQKKQLGEEEKDQDDQIKGNTNSQQQVQQVETVASTKSTTPVKMDEEAIKQQELQSASQQSTDKNKQNNSKPTKQIKDLSHYFTKVKPTNT